MNRRPCPDGRGLMTHDTYLLREGNSGDRRKRNYLALVDSLSTEAISEQEDRQVPILDAGAGPTVGAGDHGQSDSHGMNAARAAREIHDKV